MEIRVSQEQSAVPVTVLSFKGEFDCATAGKLLARANESIQAGARYLLIDLANLPYVGWPEIVAISTLLSTLCDLQMPGNRKWRTSGICDGTFISQNLKLVNASPLVREGLHTSGLDMCLEIHHDLSSAIASFGCHAVNGDGNYVRANPYFSPTFLARADGRWVR